MEVHRAMKSESRVRGKIQVSEEAVGWRVKEISNCYISFPTLISDE